MHRGFKSTDSQNSNPLKQVGESFSKGFEVFYPMD